MATTDLAAFLRARLDEDEQFTRVTRVGLRTIIKRAVEARELAEGDRRARAERGPDWAPSLPYSEQRERIYFEDVLPYLALAYSNHPDYRAEWKP